MCKACEVIREINPHLPKELMRGEVLGLTVNIMRMYLSEFDTKDMIKFLQQLNYDMLKFAIRNRDEENTKTLH